MFNNPTKLLPFRIERMSLRLQGFSFEVRHIKGKDNPSDFPSRHPLPLSLNMDEDMHITDDLNLLINNIFVSDVILDAEEIHTELYNDKTLLNVMDLLYARICPDSKDKDLQPYIRIWDELS